MKSRGVGNRDLLIHDSNRITGPTLAIIAVIVNIITVPIGIALWELFVEAPARPINFLAQFRVPVLRKRGS